MTTRPPFPTDALPRWVRDEVEALATRFQVDPGLPALGALACVSAAVGRSLYVEAWEGFRQPCLFWGVCALESGEGKTPTFNALKAPLALYEKEKRETDAERFKTDVRRHELLKAQAAAISKRAVGPNANADQMKNAEEALREADEATPKPPFRLTVDGFTTEAFVHTLAGGDGYLIHFESEGDIFDDIAGRYDSDGLLKPFLDAFDGGSIQYDRVGKGHVHIPVAKLVLGVTTQPDTLERILQKPTFKGRGLMERCFFAMPPARCGHRDPGEQPTNKAVEDTYRSRVLELAALYLDRGNEPRVLRLDADALKLFVACRGRLEGRMVAGADLEVTKAWVNKMMGAGLLRIAGLLAISNNPNTEVVSGGSMASAVRLTEDYFVPHGLYTLGHLRGPAVVDRRIEKALGWIERQTKPFTARDLARARNNLFGTVSEAVDALEELVERGQLNSFQPPRSGPGRPPGVRYSRTVLRQNRQNRQKASAHATTQSPKTNEETNGRGVLSELSVLSEGGAA